MASRSGSFLASVEGFLGGALGGALFDPVVSLATTGSGLAGRALADLVVGACIGGSMRLAQEKIVETGGKPPTQLLSVLPRKASLTFQPSQPPRPSPAAPPLPRPAPAEVPPPPSWSSPLPAPAPVPVPPASPSRSTPTANRPPLASFETGNDRETAIVLARRAGYGLGEIGQHFGLPATAVKRIVSERGG